MRGVKNDDPAHGTDAAYRKHGRDGTPRCDACKQGHARRRRNYRKRAYLARGFTLVDGTGTRRRIQALSVIGYSLTDLAPMLGVTFSAVANWGKNGRKVTITNAAQVAALYERLSGTPGPNRKAMSWSRSRSRGWAGPLDWEGRNIDDPRAMPHSQFRALVIAGRQRAKARRVEEQVAA